MKETLDIVKEVSRSAAEQTTTALSYFLQSKVILKPSFAEIISISEIHKNIYFQIREVGVLIFAKLRAGLEGELIFSLDEANAYRLVNISSMQRNEKEEEKLGAITEMGMSILKEVGNMVVGSYLTALSVALKKMITPPLPILISGSLEKIFSDVIYNPYIPVKQIQRYFVQTDFEVPKENIKGTLSLALTANSAEDIKQHCQNK